MGATQSTTAKKQAKAELAAKIRFGDVTGLLCVLLQHPKYLGSVVDRQKKATALHLAVCTGLRAPALAELTAFSSRRGQLDSKTEDALHLGLLKSLNAKDKDGFTPLMLACDVGDAECVRLLLEAGADVWARDSKHRRTCVHLASAKGHVEVLKLVIRHSMTTATVDSHGSASLLRSIATLSEQGQPQGRLLVDVPCHSGFTPAHYAALYNKPEALRVLLQAGAGFKPRSWGPYIPGDPCHRYCPGGSTALHLTALVGSLSAAKAILEEYAASLGPERRTVYALRSRSDGNPIDPRRLQDCEGRTPFAVARLLRNHLTLRLLNPLTPLAIALRGNAGAAAPLACPVDSLVQISAKVVQQVMLQQVQGLREQVQRRKAEQAQQQTQAQTQAQAQTKARAASDAAFFLAEELPVHAQGPAAHAKAPLSLRAAPSLSLRKCSQVHAGGASQVELLSKRQHKSELRQGSRRSSFSLPWGRHAPNPLDSTEEEEPMQEALDAARFHRLAHGVTADCDFSAMPEAAAASFATVQLVQQRALQPSTRSRARRAFHAPGSMTRQHLPARAQSAAVEERAVAMALQGSGVLPAELLSHSCFQLLAPGLASAPGGVRMCKDQAGTRSGRSVVSVTAASGNSGGSAVGGGEVSCAAFMTAALPEAAAQTGSLTTAAAAPAAVATSMACVATTAPSRTAVMEDVDEDVDEYEDEGLCGVCLDVGDFLMTKPCNHIICADCATELIKLHRSLLACPFCRGSVLGFEIAEDV